MIYRSPWLKLKVSRAGKLRGWYHKGKKCFCATKFNAMFGVSAKATKIRLSVHKRRKKRRLCVSFVMWPFGPLGGEPSGIVVDDVQVTLTEWMSARLREVGDAPFYLECEWK